MQHQITIGKPIKTARRNAAIPCAMVIFQL